ncbi:MAG TPA: ATPase, T2SS/T4P/T4SS family [Polyangiaceae bacterium]|nr:ATPase, T2SS/T4P/T4SS family [Polyangiaceae bacterium]
MFSVIISEKGGAERRESFDRTEINVGRVQGNDLMLPKGNVSKRHARLLYRDGRFIVTDLKSTNGTYVNGRKIAQATIVREGDKIYIGDFVLRVEMVAASGTPKPPPTAAAGTTTTTTTTTEGTGVTMPPAAESEIPDPPFGLRPPEKLPSLPPRPDQRSNGQEVSHFPLEQDPDESFPVPSPPRVPRPSVTRPNTITSPTSLSPPTPVAPAPPPAAAPPQSTSLFGPTTSASVQSPGGRRPSFHTETSDRTQAPPPPFAAHRAALVGLMERVNDAVDLATLPGDAETNDSITRAIAQALHDRVASMKIAGELRDTQPDALIAEARREIFELGPIGPMLDDEDVSEIQVLRHDYVVGMHGKKLVPNEIAFTSEQAVARVLRRLTAMSGRPLGENELFVDRRLPRGARLTAVLPPATDQGHMLLIRKPQRADLTLEDLVRSGTLSRTMASMLSTCIGARANILVTGAIGTGATSLVGALAGAGSTDDRVVVLQEDDELVFNQPHTISILLGDTREQGGRAVQAAAKMHPDRLVIGSLVGHVAAEVVEAISQGADGVLAAVRAPTLRHAVARLSASIAASKPGGTPETAREALASAFDLAIEVALQRDGRHRVMRVAELHNEGSSILVQDVWCFLVDRTAAGGTIEGTFYATGHIPAIVEDLTARGYAIDTAVFKRHQTR